MLGWGLLSRENDSRICSMLASNIGGSHININVTIKGPIFLGYSFQKYI